MPKRTKGRAGPAGLTMHHHAQDWPFYAPLAHSAISVRMPTAIAPGRLRPSGTSQATFGCDLLVLLDPGASHSLGIDEIDKLITKESKSFSDVIEAFLRSPEPPSWIPPSYATPSIKSSLGISEYQLIRMVPQVSYFTISMCAIVMK